MTCKKMDKALTFILAIVLVASMRPIPVSAATIRFTDVPSGAWYYADVTALAEKGVVSGVGDNKFEPERPVANCEMVKMLVNSFFRSEYQAYEAAHYTEMRNHFGSQLYWYSFMCYYAQSIGLLDGIHVTIESYTDCNKTMSRYNMAQILANVVKIKGIEPTAAQKAAVQGNVKDYSSMPSAYKDAVLTCFALQTKDAAGKTKSLLEGENGYFLGNASMTRAQACAVIVRLENLLINGGSTVDPDPVVTPDPIVTPEPTEKDVVVNHNQYTGVYTVTDNGYGTGKLNNGKDITEANVIELLNKAETIWTHGTKWANGGTGDNTYGNPGNVMNNLLTGISSRSAGCGGYAAMISDYLFGRTGNPCREITNQANIRPGDIIIIVDNATNKANHVMVAVSVPGGTYGLCQSARDGYIHFTDGNNSGKVTWPTKYGQPTYNSPSLNETWHVYSRYPA